MHTTISAERIFDSHAVALALPARETDESLTDYAALHPYDHRHRAFRFDVEAGNFFAGAVDPARIGVSGHSFGGYTTLAVAGGGFGLGTFMMFNVARAPAVADRDGGSSAL